jgi:hypothetical protein
MAEFGIMRIWNDLIEREDFTKKKVIVVEE